MVLPLLLQAAARAAGALVSPALSFFTRLAAGTVSKKVAIATVAGAFAPEIERATRDQTTAILGPSPSFTVPEMVPLVGGETLSRRQTVAVGIGLVNPLSLPKFAVFQFLKSTPQVVPVFDSRTQSFASPSDLSSTRLAEQNVIRQWENLTRQQSSFKFQITSKLDELERQARGRSFAAFDAFSTARKSIEEGLAGISIPKPRIKERTLGVFGAVGDRFTSGLRDVGFAESAIIKGEQGKPQKGTRLGFLSKQLGFVLPSGQFLVARNYGGFVKSKKEELTGLFGQIKDSVALFIRDRI